MPTPVRYFQPGITKVYFVLTIASLTAPTATEINAGTALTPQLADLNGFTYTNQQLAAPDWDDNFEDKVDGWDQSADSVLHFFSRRTGTTPNALRTTLAKGTVGNIVIFNEGLAGSTPAAADICDVWPGKSTGPAKDYSSSQAARWHAGWAAASRPQLDVALV